MEAPNLVVGAGVGQGWVGALVAIHLEDKNSAQAARHVPHPVGAGVGQGREGALVAARPGDKNPAMVAENARRPQD